jgi:hypothetical protein
LINRVQLGQNPLDLSVNAVYKDHITLSDYEVHDGMG